MKLNEKIYDCRRRAGLSQEALAERIGVSRQAISKWETGDASPEISKLPLLAQSFGVTTDWLLSEDEPTPDEGFAQAEPPESAPQGHPYAPEGDATERTMPDWVDKLPGFLSRMVRLYGWLVGVRLAIAGALFTAMGFVARAMFSSMNDFANEQMSGMLGGFGGSGVTFYDGAGNMVDPGSLGLSASDLAAMGLGGSTGFGGFSMSSGLPEPFSILTGFAIFLGLAMLTGGILLAWYLRKWGRGNA